jgi:hypothetical protein
MTVSGAVRIAGEEFQPKAVSSWPVLAGDEIVTAQGSRAVLLSPTAGRLEIGPDSRVTASQDTVALHGGEVGAERFVVRAGAFTATPQPDAAGRSWYVVSSRDGVPVFAAHQGDLWVSQGQPNPLLVRAGTYAVPATPPQPPASPLPAAPAFPPAPRPAGPPEPASGAAPAAPQQQLRMNQSAALPGTPAAAGAASTGWTVGSLSHASSAALASGVGAAATVGTVAGVALIEPSRRLPDRSPSSAQ